MASWPPCRIRMGSEKAGRAISVMTRESSIIELAQWLKSPPGRYLLSWEQPQLDREVSDVFGFHALQLGLPELDALRANRICGGIRRV